MYSDVDSEEFVQDMRAYGVGQALPIDVRLLELTIRPLTGCVRSQKRMSQCHCLCCAHLLASRAAVQAVQAAQQNTTKRAALHPRTAVHLHIVANAALYDLYPRSHLDAGQHAGRRHFRGGSSISASSARRSLAHTSRDSQREAASRGALRFRCARRAAVAATPPDRLDLHSSGQFRCSTRTGAALRDSWFCAL